MCISNSIYNEQVYNNLLSFLFLSVGIYFNSGNGMSMVCCFFGGVFFVCKHGTTNPMAGGHEKGGLKVEKQNKNSVLFSATNGARQ